MNIPDDDLLARLRKADPMNRLLPDDPDSSTASRVFDRAVTAEALKSSSRDRAPRIRASRALPVLAVAAAIIAVVGLSLPRNAPGPVRATLGSEPASADQAKLLRAAKHQEAQAADEDPARVVQQQEFLGRFAPYPHDPTSQEVLAWLGENCAEVNGPLLTDGPAANLDCVLMAAPTVVNGAPAHVAADVLRALATLDVGLPTHAQRCPGWASVDPAWRAKVERTEAATTWVKRNGTLLVVNGVLPEERKVPVQGADRLTDEGGATLRVSASVSPASPESEVFVQCEPATEGGAGDLTLVERALRDYAEAHGDGCVLGQAELEGLIAVDLAQACSIRTSEEISPEGDPNASGEGNGAVAPLGDDAEPTMTTSVPDPNAVTTTSVGGPVDVTTTSVDG